MTSKKRGKGGHRARESEPRGEPWAWEDPRQEAASGKVLWDEAEKSAARSDGTDTHGQPGVERTVYAVLY